MLSLIKQMTTTSKYITQQITHAGHSTENPRSQAEILSEQGKPIKVGVYPKPQNINKSKTPPISSLA
jgi:hypothetical protein